MFNYFGSKGGKLLDLYPKPLYDQIIEPFAGSARYALRYYERDVWINDLDPVIYEVWQWLLQATPRDIRSLPELRYHEKLTDYTQLSDTERKVLGFCTNLNTAVPSNTVTEFASSNKLMRRFKQRALFYCPRIRHWRLTNLSYAELPNLRATWYIDPPYQVQGKSYKHGPEGIDFSHLAEWCKERRGQVMVCEGIGATWLPFRPLTPPRKRERMRRHVDKTKPRYRELLWYRSDKKTGLGLW